MARIAVALLLLALLPSAGLAEKRIALLIGNKDYKPGVGALVNPLNDVRRVGEALKAVGFEVLPPVQNARRADMLLAIYDFASKLKSAGANAIGFLYYSGHGVASAGENYLIPTDVDEPSTRLLAAQGVKQNDVLTILRNEAPHAAHYLVLDACRNTLQGARGGKGFVPVGQQSGVLVAFATEPGKTASDVGKDNGPYATALAAELVRPDQNDLLMFHRVRIAVVEATSGDQVPWTEDGIQRRERISFAGQSLASEAAQLWAVVKDSTNDVLLEAFIQKFGGTPYEPRARARLAEVTGAGPSNTRFVGDKIEAFPWHVALEVKSAKGRRLCGGAIIAQNWILTTAHCLSRGTQTEGIRVKAGQTNLTNGSWEQVERIIIHAEYNPLTSEHDIALVKLKEPARGRVVPIQGSLESIQVGAALEVSGWGTTALDGEASRGPGNQSAQG